MEFKKYQHIERLGTAETNGIENGMCYIFPKIDGTNSQLWLDGILRAWSRNRQLELDNDNAGFYNWAIKQEHINNFFKKHPDLRLYGEWLVPHTLRTYRDDAWNMFYVFDVMDGDKYMNYEEYKIILEEFNIEYIPPICKVNNPTYDSIVSQLEKNGYLIKDGNGTGEGVVIKNYDYVNKFGRVTWAKVVKNEFKAKHSKVQVTEVKEAKLIEQDIVDKYITKSLVEKEFSKIDNESGWSSKYIIRLFSTVYYCLIKEESWNFIKEFNNPTIDYKRVYRFATIKIKELMPQLF